VTAKAKPTCVLALQGGGALGAYQLGAYQAMAERGFEPDWFSGISIGAITAAILAGNPPAQRAERLAQFWQAISRPDFGGSTKDKALQRLRSEQSYAQALALGQPNFFVPRLPSPLLASPGPGATSFYDTAPLRATLERLANFDQINAKAGKTRLLLGAVDIATSALTVFDNAKTRIGPEHAMASGALPPGFPPIEIDGHCYWDGGCVANTPLDFVVDELPEGHSIIFVIDLWQAEGPVPKTLNDVLWRQKQIQYSTRTALQLDALVNRLKLRHAQNRLASADGDARRRNAEEDHIDLVHIAFHSADDQFANSDVDFSRSGIEERRASGYRDMLAALDAEPWLTARHPTHAGARVHSVTKGRVVAAASPVQNKRPG
jgi:NTE family protein